MCWKPFAEFEAKKKCFLLKFHVGGRVIISEQLQLNIEKSGLIENVHYAGK
jgi:hypothetical protein